MSVGVLHQHPWHPPTHYTHTNKSDKMHTHTHRALHATSPLPRAPTLGIRSQAAHCPASPWTRRDTYGDRSGSHWANLTSTHHQTHCRPQHTWLTGLCTHSSDTLLTLPHCAPPLIYFVGLSPIQITVCMKMNSHQKRLVNTQLCELLSNLNLHIIWVLNTWCENRLMVPPVTVMTHSESKNSFVLFSLNI